MTNLDLAAIRRGAGRGEPQLPATVVALCDHVASMQRLAEHATARRVVDRFDMEERADSDAADLHQLQYEYGQLYIAHQALLSAARAYFAAVDRCDGIAAAEQALREAVESVRNDNGQTTDN